ncbi:hypothetical protein MPH_03037 [Macrophomina phaseolina MS6]|uniref:Fork-head domain-containing protein n=1 Tax=Macrophomina phaseolina (strain MS6) TaxID=1126212 RepID=K2SBE7_MACPH|nr:hypothetical protein MPH_03037 [Macrophomina phaseolina MS6]
MCFYYPDTEEQLEVTLGSDVHVLFPAGVLAQQGTQVIINYLMARYPPDPPPLTSEAPAPVDHAPATTAPTQQSARHMEIADRGRAEAYIFGTDPSIEFDSLFTAAVGSRATAPAANQLVSQLAPTSSHFTAVAPDYCHQHNHYHTNNTSSLFLPVSQQVCQPASSLFTTAPDYQSTAFTVSAPAAPAPAAVSTNNKKPTTTKATAATSTTITMRHPRRKTPPGFPGYGAVARLVALQVAAHRPFVQLADIYAYMEGQWPEWFRCGRSASSSWQSGVRHAVLKGFERVEAARAPSAGVWYRLK